MSDQTKPATKRPRKMAREPQAEAALTPAAAPTAVKTQTKALLVETLLQADPGASIEELCSATDWLPHTCRAFLTGLRKKGKTIERLKRGDVTIYKMAVAMEAA